MPTTDETYCARCEAPITPATDAWTGTPTWVGPGRSDVCVDGDQGGVAVEHAHEPETTGAPR